MNDVDTTVDVDTSVEKDTTNDDISNPEVVKFKEIAENYRIRAEKAEAKLKSFKTLGQLDADAIREEARRAAREEFEQTIIEDLEYSDTIKDEIKNLAKLKGVTVKVAAKDPYIAHLVQQEEHTRKMNEAADNGSKKSGSVSYDPNAPFDPSQFDLNTEEGREAYNEYKRIRNAARNKKL